MLGMKGYNICSHFNSAPVMTMVHLWLLNYFSSNCWYVDIERAFRATTFTVYGKGNSLLFLFVLET